MQKGMLSYQEIAAFCQELALLMQAGIRLSDGVFLMAEEEKGQYCDVYKEIGEKLDQGEILSVALEACGCFPAYVFGMISVGEKTGRLEESLFSLADYYEERCRVNRMLKSSLTYPMVIMVLIMAVVGVLLIKVLPVFDKVYMSLGSRLTGAAAGLLQVGYGLKAALPFLFGFLVVGIVLVVLFAKVSRFREKVLFVFANKFGDKGISKKLNNAKFARALAMGLTSGLTMEEALEQVRTLFVDVPGALKRCDKCLEMLEEGMELSVAMRENEFLQASYAKMLAVGMRGGNGDRVMTEVADRMMEDAGLALDNAVAKVEPAMVLAASVIVGMILLAVMLPLANIMASIG